MTDTPHSNTLAWVREHNVGGTDLSYRSCIDGRATASTAFGPAYFFEIAGREHMQELRDRLGVLLVNGLLRFPKADAKRSYYLIDTTINGEHIRQLYYAAAWHGQHGYLILHPIQDNGMLWPPRRSYVVQISAPVICEVCGNSALTADAISHTEEECWK